MLVVTGIGKAFAGRRVFDDVTVTLDRGVTALLGINGAGKTTLLRILAQTLRSDAGRFSVVADPGPSAESGGPARDPGDPTLIGYMPQFGPSQSWLTASTYVTYAGFLSGLSRSAARERADHLLREYGLTALARRTPAQLSGGERRKLALATAMVTDPPVLLLDEPTAGLDPVQRDEVVERIRELGSTRCVLFSTHLVDDAVAVTARTLLLHYGRTTLYAGLDDLVRASGVDPSPAGEVATVRAAFVALVGGRA